VIEGYPITMTDNNNNIIGASELCLKVLIIFMNTLKWGRERERERERELCFYSDLQYDIRNCIKTLSILLWQHKYGLKKK
jgi:hypothetical protein